MSKGNYNWTWRLVYRFMSDEELQRLLAAKKSSQGSMEKTMGHAQNLEVYMGKLVNAITSGSGAIGNMIHGHTMTEQGGGQIGKSSSQLVSMTEDEEKLAKSTDPRVQSIVKSALWLVQFTVPNTAVLGAPSELSKSEGEVLMPNQLDSLAAMLTDYIKNPYLPKKT